MGEGQLADKLARRAEAVFAHHPFWSRKASNFAKASMDRSPRDGRRRTSQAAQFQSQRQREFILTSMRHWLAGELARESPAFFWDEKRQQQSVHKQPAFGEGRIFAQTPVTPAKSLNIGG